ncbi:uncharacterized protein LOC142558105 [Dermacentor variabilis]|uniref:uncharacterized protein LOC142558105 n=1 Tax=Dermacentor variabilis TaxID=34621 RepID=UPI003F5B6AC5
MCICETAFEVTMLASFCLLVNGLQLLFFITVGLDDAETITGAIVSGAFVAHASILLVGVMTGNKKLVDTFVFLAKIRVLLYCLMLFYVSFLVFKGGSDNKRAHKIIGTYGLNIILTKLAEKTEKEKFKQVLAEDTSTWMMGKLIIDIMIDVFVIYRIGIFSDRMGAS